MTVYLLLYTFTPLPNLAFIDRSSSVGVQVDSCLKNGEVLRGKSAKYYADLASARK